MPASAGRRVHEPRRRPREPIGFAAGELTYGEAFDVQPFGNTMVTITLTGAQLLRGAEAAVVRPGGRRGILLRPAAVHYTYSGRGAAIAGQRATARQPGHVATIGGAASIRPRRYRVTVNNFLADGGDGFTELRDGTNRAGGASTSTRWSPYLSRQRLGAAAVPR